MAARRFDWYRYRSGATKTDRNPASRSKISLKKKKTKISEHDVLLMYIELLHILINEKTFLVLEETNNSNLRRKVPPQCWMLPSVIHYVTI